MSFRLTRFRERRLFYATIPGEHRFSAIAGRNVMYDQEDLTGGIAIAIRVHSDDVAFGLQDYGLSQGSGLHKINPLKDIKDPEDPYERLLLSIKTRRSYSGFGSDLNR